MRFTNLTVGIAYILPSAVMFCFAALPKLDQVDIVFYTGRYIGG